MDVLVAHSQGGRRGHVLLPFLPEDVLEDALADADVPTLRALKGVSKAWRARAARPVRAAVRTIRPAARESPRRGDRAHLLSQARAS